MRKLLVLGLLALMTLMTGCDDDSVTMKYYELDILLSDAYDEGYDDGWSEGSSDSYDQGFDDGYYHGSHDAENFQIAFKMAYDGIVDEVMNIASDYLTTDEVFEIYDQIENQAPKIQENP